MNSHYMNDPASLTDAIETKNRLEAIITTAMDAIITIDNDHRIIFFNPAAEAMFGLKSSEALGEPIARFIPERFRAAHEGHIRRFGRTGETGRRMGALGAISGLRINGQEFPVEASISQAVVGKERLSTVILRDITERKANEEARSLLAREVDHRAKNALAIVQALVSLTKAPTRDTFVEAVTGRVSALARAHSLLAQNRWSGAQLRKIIQDEVSAYERPGQVRYDGPDIMLSPKAVQPIGLLTHELATNAVKYGALSVHKGRVDIKWEVKDDRLLLIWRESGGPPVSPPQQKGFGSNLITTVTGLQLGGNVEIEWARTGILVTADLPTTVVRQQDAAPPAIAEQTGPSAEQDRSPATGTLLVVEDEMLIAMQMAESLQEAGWSVLGPAATMEEARQILSTTAQQPDAAILDVNLDGKTVYPLAEVLQRKGIPILFCTGYETLDAGRFEDCDRLRKPASAHQIIAAVRIAIEKQRQAPVAT